MIFGTPFYDFEFYPRCNSSSSRDLTVIMVYSDYVKQRILYFRRMGESYGNIINQKEGHKTTKAGVYKFCQRYEETGTISRATGSGKTSKFSEDAEKIIEDQMTADDEITGVELEKRLHKNGIHVCSRTALEWRKQLGWTTKSTRYCQMIREVNEMKRLEWAKENKDMWFGDVIYTDETTVQMESHRRLCS